MCLNSFFTKYYRLFTSVAANSAVIVGCVLSSTVVYAEDPMQVLDYPTKVVSKDDDCLILNEDLRDTWTPQEESVGGNWEPKEKLMWEQICKKGVVDLDGEDYKNFSREVCQKGAVDLDGEDYKNCLRKVSSEFLRTILLREPFRSALPEKIVIKNAVFSEDIDLDSASIDVELHLEGATFNKDVKLYKANFSNSLYLDNSTFKTRLSISHAFIKGDLFVRNAKFEPYIGYLTKNPQEEIVIFNLDSINVDGSLDFSNSSLTDLTPQNYTQSNSQKKAEQKKVTLLKLLTAKVGNSIYLTNFNFLGKKNGEEPSQVLDFTAIQVSDAIVIDDQTRFQELNLSNAQLKSFIIKRPKEQVDNFEKIKLSQEFYSGIKSLIGSKGKSDNVLTNIPIDTWRIIFQDAVLNNFQILDKSIKSDPIFIIPDQDKPIKDHKVSQNFSIPKEPIQTTKTIDEYFPKDKSKLGTYEEKPTCLLELDGLQYKKANDNGFKLLAICLKNQYKEALAKDKKEKSEDRIAKYNKLFQPFEQAASIARQEGKYSLEKELLYRRKKLEYFIAKNSSMPIETFALWVADIFYGFGYQRWKSFILFLAFWIIGFFVTFFHLKSKQKKISDEAWILREEIVKNLEKVLEGKTEIQDQKTILTNKKTLQTIIFKGEIKYKERCIFNKIYIITPDKIQKSIYLIFEDDTYFILKDLDLKDKVKRQRFHTWLNYLELNSPNHIKLGFCQNIFPNKGLWMVEDQGVTGNKSEYKFCDLYENDFYNTFWKNLRIVTFYSLDILLPIIDLDPKVQAFIFEDANGLTKIYFLSQKLLAGILGAILIPVLFITGL